MRSSLIPSAKIMIFCDRQLARVAESVGSRALNSSGAGYAFRHSGERKFDGTAGMENNIY